MMANKPDFFLVGAPKCGTTSFFRYLSSHPMIFLPVREDIHYFSRDFDEKWEQIDNEKDYLALFRKVYPQQLVIGERSNYYLYSRVAMKNLSNFDPAARLIVMLRNPVNMVQSFHSQLNFSLNENEPDFEKAWRLQESRGRGENIPKTCRDPQVLQYGNIARFGEQVSRMRDFFPEDQIHYIFFEDLVKSTSDVYRGVLSFLGVPDDHRTEFPRMNARKEHKSKWLAKLVMRQPAPLRFVTQGIKKLFNLEQTGIGVALLKANAAPKEKKIISVDLRKELTAYFADDVNLLSEITKRDLSAWRGLAE